MDYCNNLGSSDWKTEPGGEMSQQNYLAYLNLRRREKSSNSVIKDQKVTVRRTRRMLYRYVVDKSVKEPNTNDIIGELTIDGKISKHFPRKLLKRKKLLQNISLQPSFKTETNSYIQSKKLSKDIHLETSTQSDNSCENILHRHNKFSDGTLVLTSDTSESFENKNEFFIVTNDQIRRSPVDVEIEHSYTVTNLKRSSNFSFGKNIKTDFDLFDSSEELSTQNKAVQRSGSPKECKAIEENISPVKEVDEHSLIEISRKNHSVEKECKAIEENILPVKEVDEHSLIEISRKNHSVEKSDFQQSRDQKFQEIFLHSIPKEYITGMDHLTSVPHIEKEIEIETSSAKGIETTNVEQMRSDTKVISDSHNTVEDDESRKNDSFELTKHVMNTPSGKQIEDNNSLLSENYAEANINMFVCLNLVETKESSLNPSNSENNTRKVQTTSENQESKKDDQKMADTSRMGKKPVDSIQDEKKMMRIPPIDYESFSESCHVTKQNLGIKDNILQTYSGKVEVVQDIMGIKSLSLVSSDDSQKDSRKDHSLSYPNEETSEIKYSLIWKEDKVENNSDKAQTARDTFDITEISLEPSENDNKQQNDEDSTTIKDSDKMTIVGETIGITSLCLETKKKDTTKASEQPLETTIKVEHETDSMKKNEKIEDNFSPHLLFDIEVANYLKPRRYDVTTDNLISCQKSSNEVTLPMDNSLLDQKESDERSLQEDNSFSNQKISNNISAAINNSMWDKKVINNPTCVKVEHLISDKRVSSNTIAPIQNSISDHYNSSPKLTSEIKPETRKPTNFNWCYHGETKFPIWQYKEVESGLPSRIEVVHYKPNNFNERKYCPYCNIGITNEIVLEKHIGRCKMIPDNAKIDPLKTFFCEYCNFGITDEVFFRQHKKKCQYKVDCKTQDNLSSKPVIQENVPKFKRKRSTIGKHKCPSCEYTSDNISHMLMHRRTHDKIPLCVCDVCQKGFTRLDALKIHMFKHINLARDILEGKKIDVWKGKATKSTIEVKIKNKYFTLVKYQCSKCKYATPVAVNMENHFDSIHLNITNFKCNLCSFATNQKSNLTKHLNTHSREKTYKCSFCSYETINKSYIKHHENQIHLKAVSFKCGSCDFVAYRKENLKAHINCMHLKLKKYQCEQCNYFSYVQSNLINHVKSMHEGIKRKYKKK